MSDGCLRVVVVDDQRLVRSGFAMMLGAEDDIVVAGEAANGAEAIDLVRRERPDVVLMDVQMPVLDGIAATATIVGEDLAKVIILTTFDRDDYLFDALRNGASGFLLKNTDPDDLAEAVRAVGHGHALLAPEVTRRVIEAMTRESPRQPEQPGRDSSAPRSAPGAPAAPADPLAADPRLRHLTARELEVLGLVGRGLSNAEIAATLFVGEATVKTHVSSCLAKLHLRDRVQAVVLAYETGLVVRGG
ncbi:LuxR family transcriptional regulator [Intrasporangium chromatireducens Q5-1]|uniref:LuxR family transcriptional regulator n=1 Tax=Intrasporangium chromatireducens Q5-1 TaxID=584657 RepID=W9GMN6_9MICO|nr:response regulator transcription factor [Intrasporangium chromatireducens]EWT07496.1 LuxR family transcriptional regulator [Intrasporangium chromatireducens Q5-1]